MAIFNYITLSQPLVLLAFIVALIYLNKSNVVNRALIAILSICTLTEIITTVFIVFEMNISLVYNISLAFHNCLWLVLLTLAFKKKWLKMVVLGYFLYCLLNLFVIEGINYFNYNIFIVGALLYISIFISESFLQLKRENFGFFMSNLYVVLYAPIVFFFSMGFIFAFRTFEFGNVFNIDLYDFIISYVNLIYYSLVIFYIYREKKLAYGS